MFVKLLRCPVPVIYSTALCCSVQQKQGAQPCSFTVSASFLEQIKDACLQVQLVLYTARPQTWPPKPWHTQYAQHTSSPGALPRAAHLPNTSTNALRASQSDNLKFLTTAKNLRCLHIETRTSFNHDLATPCATASLQDPCGHPSLTGVMTQMERTPWTPSAEHCNRCLKTPCMQTMHTALRLPQQGSKHQHTQQWQCMMPHESAV